MQQRTLCSAVSLLFQPEKGGRVLLPHCLFCAYVHVCRDMDACALEEEPSLSFLGCHPPCFGDRSPSRLFADQGAPEIFPSLPPQYGVNKHGIATVLFFPFLLF